MINIILEYLLDIYYIYKYKSYWKYNDIHNYCYMEFIILNDIIVIQANYKRLYNVIFKLELHENSFYHRRDYICSLSKNYYHYNLL